MATISMDGWTLSACGHNISGWLVRSWCGHDINGWMDFVGMWPQYQWMAGEIVVWPRYQWMDGLCRHVATISVDGWPLSACGHASGVVNVHGCEAIFV